MASEPVAVQGDVSGPEFALRTPITADQFEDFWRTVHEWERIRRENGYDRDATLTDIYKSCLLGRMTMHGKDPLPHPPPTANSAPWYSLIETGWAYLHDHEGPYVGEEYVVLLGCAKWQLVSAGDVEMVLSYPNYGRWRVRHLTPEEAIERRHVSGHRKNDADLWEPTYYGEADYKIERID